VEELSFVGPIWVTRPAPGQAACGRALQLRRSISRCRAGCCYIIYIRLCRLRKKGPKCDSCCMWCISFSP
jgi:hypothetical protein